MAFNRSVKAGFLCFGAILLLSGCGLFSSDRWQGNDPDAQQRAEDPYHTDPKYIAGTQGSFNPRTQTDSNRSVLSLFFNNNNTASTNSGGGGAPGVGVNSFLWHASLDTVSFMPLASADPFGGVIITDWFSPPQTPDERFKVNIFILNRELRADGVRCSVFRQARDSKGNWIDAPVDKNTSVDLENAILARARQIRLSTASNQQ
ncbi:MAG TPA: DUF3576 domain-containing protein [Stellaceae bacterium]|nr:DUF3576 domain-containing protein [Stellaceae bacterium]